MIRQDHIVMPAACAYIAGMQYTLRGIPPAVDRALRERARMDGISLNQAAVEALARAVGLGDQPVRYRSLDAVRGTWHDDPESDRAIAQQHRIDESLWS
ncbi:MAG: hypothetical protein AMS20_13260 [Gemmatimonas sp. SG8_28]|jgi:hypothetical protein|nr:MAG: hypothetical protein AMS20_13260 [Gemmatimonas sp. SG8_28]